MTLVSERLRTLRIAYRGRGDARAGQDVAYLLYAGVLVVAIAIFPLVRTVVVLLAEPSVVNSLRAADFETQVGSICGLLIVGLFALGRLRGPVTPSPFFVLLLATTDLPRSRGLRWPFVTSALIVAMATTSIGALFAGVLTFSESSTSAAGLVFVAGCACAGTLMAVAWLAGQAWPARWVWIVGAALVAAVAFTGLAPAAGAVFPWAWVGMLWPVGSVVTVWPLIALLCVTAAAVVNVPRLLNSLHGTQLRDSAARWETAGTAAMSGDVGYALGTFRAKPTRGRAWNAVNARNVSIRFLRADIVAALRTPARFSLGITSLIIGWSLLSIAPTTEPTVVWLPAAAGSGIAYLALGIFSDGFRHAAEATATPPLYGYSTARLYALHALLPMALATAPVIVAAAAVFFGALPVSVWPVGPLAVLLVLVRAYDSAKGELPLIFLTPVSSPVGDPSVLFVLIWHADALLIATVTGAAFIYLASSGLWINASVVFLTVAVGLVFLLRRRLHKL